jgi:UPF0755 protein
MNQRTGGCFLRLLLVAVVLLALAAGGVAYFLTSPYQGFQHEVFLDFAKGTSTASMADQLAAAGVIRRKWDFLAVRALQPRARLQAGEYRFATPASVWTVFTRIVRGDVFYYEVTIPEGSNMFDVAQILDKLGFIKGPDFLKIARSPALIVDLSPHAPSLEGYLFPSTYRLTRRATAAQVARMMTELFRRRWQELQKPNTPIDVNRLVTLASIVEKETGISSDRPRVASVYANRLRLGMTLDCDPTTIYAALLENRYRGVIHRSDLDNNSPYNTYRHPGLPPGPIANPGQASLEAALQPAQTDFLYFVAKPDGSGQHWFSTTLAEHTRHVQDYRRGIGGR